MTEQHVVEVIVDEARATVEAVVKTCTNRIPDNCDSYECGRPVVRAGRCEACLPIAIVAAVARLDEMEHAAAEARARLRDLEGDTTDHAKRLAEIDAAHAREEQIIALGCEPSPRHVERGFLLAEHRAASEALTAAGIPDDGRSLAERVEELGLKWRAAEKVGGDIARSHDHVRAENDRLAERVKWLAAARGTEETTDGLRERVLAAIDSVAAYYPADMFPPDGTSTDAKNGTWARHVVGLVRDEVEKALAEDEPAAPAVVAETDIERARRTAIASHNVGAPFNPDAIFGQELRVYHPEPDIEPAVGDTPPDPSR